MRMLVRCIPVLLISLLMSCSSGDSPPRADSVATGSSAGTPQVTSSGTPTESPHESTPVTAPGIPTSPPFDPPAEIKATIGGDVPAAVTESITGIYSSEGNADAAGILRLPARPKGGDALLLALKDERILLMSFASGNAMLNAQSTAEALVRIALPSTQPQDITLPDLTAAIRNTAGFSALVACVSEALARGESPAETIAIEPQVLRVAREAIQALSPSPRLAPSVTLSGQTLPWELINASPNQRAWFSDSPIGSSSIQFNNRTLLSWQISVDPPLTSSGAVKIAPPGEEKMQQLLAYYGGSESITPIAGLDPRFRLVATQRSGDVRVRNAILWFAYAFRVFMEVFTRSASPTVEQCATTIATRFVNDKLPDIANQADGAAYVSYIQAAAEWTAGAGNTIHTVEIATLIADTLGQCALTPLERESLQKYFAGALSNAFIKAFLFTFDAAKLARTVFQFVDLTYQMRIYHDMYFEANICRFEGASIPCTFNLNVDPPTATVKKGETVVIRDKLTDHAGRESLGLASIAKRWRSDRPDVASIPNPELGVVHGVATGTATITVERIIDPLDPVGRIEATAIVTVTDTNQPPPSNDNGAVNIAVTKRNCSTIEYQVGHESTNYNVVANGCIVDTVVSVSCPGGCYALKANGEADFQAPLYSVVEATELATHWNSGGDCGNLEPVLQKLPEFLRTDPPSGTNMIAYRAAGHPIVFQSTSHPTVCKRSGARAYTYTFRIRNAADQSEVVLSGSTGDITP